MENLSNMTQEQLTEYGKSLLKKREKLFPNGKSLFVLEHDTQPCPESKEFKEVVLNCIKLFNEINSQRRKSVRKRIFDVLRGYELSLKYQK